MLLRVVTLTVLCASVVIATLAIRYAVGSGARARVATPTAPLPGEAVFESFGDSARPRDVTGTVLDVSGKPCVRARVHAVRVERGGWMALFDRDMTPDELAAGVTFTGREGEFALTPRTELPCALWIESESGERAHVRACRGGERLLVRLAANAPGAPASPAQARRVEAALTTVDGTFVDENGAPVAGVRVCVVDSWLIHRVVSDQDSTPAERSRADGSFSVSYPQSMRAPMLVAWKSELAVHTTRLRWDTLADPWTIVLVPGATITGCVIDHPGSPLIDTEVALRGNFGFPFMLKDERDGVVLATTRSDSLGRFRFEDVPEGAWRAEAQSGSFASHSELLRVRPDTPRFDVRVDFIRRTASLTGTILRSSGVPAENAPVSFYVDDFSRVQQSAIADSRGCFALSSLRDETGWVLATFGWPVTERGVLRWTSGETDVVLRMRPTIRVEGRVIDETGAAGYTWLVRVSSDVAGAAPISVETDAEGRFAFRMEDGASLELSVVPLALDPSKPRSALSAVAPKPTVVSSIVAGKGPIEIRVPAAK